MECQREEEDELMPLIFRGEKATEVRASGRRWTQQVAKGNETLNGWKTTALCPLPLRLYPNHMAVPDTLIITHIHPKQKPRLLAAIV